MSIRLLLVGCLSLVSALSAFATDPDVLNAEALQKTQALLTDPVARGEAVKSDPNAKQADQNLKALGLSPADQEKAYRLSGQLLETIVKQTGGDPARMAEKMQNYQRDPSSLEKDLTPEQRKAIEGMSRTLPAAQPAKPN